jgi:hypothetical protein
MLKSPDMTAKARTILSTALQSLTRGRMPLLAARCRGSHSVICGQLKCRVLWKWNFIRNSEEDEKALTNLYHQ